MIDVVVAGHFCIDIIAELSAQAAASPTLMAPGRLTMLEQGSITTGGAVSNTGLALYRLGTQVGLMARLGNDPVGHLTRELVARHDPALVEHLHMVEGETSAYTIVANAPGRDRSFLQFGGANDRFGPDDLDVELLEQARLFHLGYPPLLGRTYRDGGESLSTMMGMARQAGCTTSLDLSMPDPTAENGRADWPKILARTLPLVDVFVPSIEELLFMLYRDRFDTLTTQAGEDGLLGAISMEDIQALAELSLGLGAKIVLLKLGQRGGYLRTVDSLGTMGRARPQPEDAWRDRELWAPCFRVEVANTVGAGDAAVAGFLTGLLRGLAPENALLAAMAVGACNVEVAGGANGVLSWEMTQARIDAGWPQDRGDVAADEGTPKEEQVRAPSVWQGPQDGAGLARPDQRKDT